MDKKIIMGFCILAGMMIGNIVTVAYIHGEDIKALRAEMIEMMKDHNDDYSFEIDGKLTSAHSDIRKDSDWTVDRLKALAKKLGYEWNGMRCENDWEKIDKNSVIEGKSTLKTVGAVICIEVEGHPEEAKCYPN